MLLALQTLYPAIDVNIVPGSGLLLIVSCFEAMPVLMSSYCLQLCLANLACVASLMASRCA